VGALTRSWAVCTWESASCGVQLYVHLWWLSAALLMLKMQMHVAVDSEEGVFLGGGQWSGLAAMAMARIRCIDIACWVAHMQLGVQLEARGASPQRSCTLNYAC
jgi:hypothetical protein